MKAPSKKKWLILGTFTLLVIFAGYVRFLLSLHSKSSLEEFALTGDALNVLTGLFTSLSFLLVAASLFLQREDLQISLSEMKQASKMQAAQARIALLTTTYNDCEKALSDMAAKRKNKKAELEKRYEYLTEIERTGKINVELEEFDSQEYAPILEDMLTIRGQLALESEKLGLPTLSRRGQEALDNYLRDNYPSAHAARKTMRPFLKSMRKLVNPLA